MILSKQVRHLGLLVRRKSERPAADVEVITTPQSAVSDAFKLTSTKPGNDAAPLPDGSGSDVQRPGDIRGVLKVINNVLFEHNQSYTGVKSALQPQCKTDGLTSVAMEKRLLTLADRLNDALRARCAETGEEITKSDLARACGVSPAAVAKWLTGDTKQLKAENYRDAAKALWVSEEWLRDGVLPRERGVNGNAEAHMDRVMDLLEDLSGPLAALATAIDQIRKTRPETGKGRRKA
jgi:transcriptional regulator with XRE-family HTH domain